jgi:hypothetical protein
VIRSDLTNSYTVSRLLRSLSPHRRGKLIKPDNFQRLECLRPLPPMLTRSLTGTKPSRTARKQVSCRSRFQILWLKSSSKAI